MKINYETVPVEKLRWTCDVETIKEYLAKKGKSIPAILGQDRAVRAIEVGLDMEFPGYNLYVAGASGTGRTTTVRHLLNRRKNKKQPPPDICYVNNFKNPDMPIVLTLPHGEGKKLKTEMADLVHHLRVAIPKVFDSDEYREKREAVAEKFDDNQRNIIADLEKKAKKQNFALVQVQVGPFTKPDVLPIINNQPVQPAQLQELVNAGTISQEQAEAILQNYEELAKELAKTFKATQKLQKQKKLELESLDRQIVKPMVEEAINDVREKFTGEKITGFLQAAQESLLSRLALFRGKSEYEENQIEKKPALKSQHIDPFLEYHVNVIVDNSETKGAPVVFENAPSFAKLFGTFERVTDSHGQWRTDFTKIRAGSLLMANGGFLVVYALDVLLEPGVWNNLKRVLKNRKTEIQGYDPYFMFAFSAIKPEPIDISVTVIMIGDSFLYRILYDADQDFQKIFKIKADFDAVMKNDKDNLAKYAEFVKRISESDKLLRFDESGIAAIAEYGVRLAGRTTKLSTQFNDIADLAREASFYAQQEKADVITAEYVDKAIAESMQRFNLIEDKIQEMIKDGTIMIDTEGHKVGQVNGLSVLSLGDYTFGRPSRITAQVAIGQAGIINIERESALSGPTHDKGVLILSGFLQGKFAQNKPLAISASIAFEQSYSGIDGDSASSTEIYALLSRLADIPIRQDIAVTGSVNQNGDIQPIGGVNEKIEGFYKVCKAKGLTGKQGVLIPRLNVADLMLSKEVVKAVAQGKFHIYPTESIDQGIEILTGLPAGEKDEKGNYPQDSVYGRVDKKLESFAERLRYYMTRSI
ncbi:ATP-dependent protease [candidate division KSB1 bacterium RBG_16_48_16]|nr:MAG: ATP-dependent protease [candidate division KSB1 bacterium RBG_16_48_16]